MEPLEFLAVVLPSPGHGYYCAAELSSNKKQHVFVEDIGAIAPYVEQWQDSRHDIYFALASFEDKGKRTAENAQYLRSMFIDMDGYESKKAAALALSGFLEKTGLDCFGTPWIVGSGGGLHCYWAFKEDIEVSDWKPVAEKLKRLCKQEALSIDMSVTADAARVLRIPGTMNFKKKYGTPRSVSLLNEGGLLDFSEFAQRIDSLLTAAYTPPPVSSLSIEGERPRTEPSATGVKLMSNTISRFKTILIRTQEGDGCQQLEHFIEHAHEDGMEPLWRAWLSQAKYCADGERAAVMLSNLHPYDIDRMHAKLRDIKGPYPCLKFDSENPGVCSGCKHFGKITNPLALGKEVATDNSEKVIEVVQIDTEEPDLPPIPVQVVRPTPPKGFSYGVNGGVFAERMVEEADGTMRKKQIMLLPYDLFVVDLLNKEGEHTVHMMANRPEGATDVLVPQRYTVSKDEMLKTLAQQNIIASFGSGNDKNLFEYVRACIEEASTSKRAIVIPAQYGWQEDSTFVYNGKVYLKDGTTRKVPMPDLANLTRNTRSMGTLEEWRKLPQMLIRRELYEHLAIGCIAFGAPLMRFTQMNCLTFHAGSTDSGTGKTLALNLLNSVWGHPVKYRTGKGTSPVTMQQRMGNLNSLPFTSDEITHKSRNDMEWFPGLVFDLSEGQGKEKSEAHHNRERINNVSWSSLAYLTSNTIMHDYMAGARTHTSQGELLRMLEWVPEQKLNWTEDEEELLKVLETNHGVAGDRYVRWLVQNQEQAREVLQKTVRYLKKKWSMRGDERFWAAGCGAVVAGAILASEKYANIIDLPVDKIIDALFALVERARKVVRTGQRSAEDILNMFTREHYGQFVVLRISDGKLLAALGTGEQIDQSITRNKVMGRVEHGISKVGFVEYFIEEQVMKAHCVSLSYGFDMFKRKIAETKGYVVSYQRKDMLARTRGPQMRVRAISISRPMEEDEAAMQDAAAEGLSLG